MATLTIRLEERQLKELQRLASDNNQTMNDYILDVIFHTTTSDTKLTLQKVVEIALEQAIDSEFSLPSLFSLDVWKTFNPSDKRIVGRTFYKSVQDHNNPLSKNFTFVGKMSNIAIYKRMSI